MGIEELVEVMLSCVSRWNSFPLFLSRVKTTTRQGRLSVYLLLKDQRCDFVFLSFQKKILKDSLLLMPAAEDRLEVKLHNLFPSHQVHSLNLFIVG